MKPYYTKVTSHLDPAIKIRYDEMPHFYPHWHYHDEYELVYIHQSSGIRYVGDNISPYHPGDLVLLGSSLPHIWINEADTASTSPPMAAATVIHLQPQFVHNRFFDLPAMGELKNLFEQIHRGIRFIGVDKIEDDLQYIQQSSGANRVIRVLHLLSRLSSHAQFELLSSKAYHQISSRQRNDRLSNIHNYIARHFRAPIQLDTLADIACMTPQAFCTYFKRKTGKTVFTYINKLRIGYSCKLLIETEWTISHIAQESGFNSTTFYNRKFKENIGITPKVYRKKHQHQRLY
jgi:AraC-like DNA-binding protein